MTYERALDVQAACARAWGKPDAGTVWNRLFECDEELEAHRLARAAAQVVSLSIPFYVHADISQALLQAAESFPADVPLRHDEPPGLAGFVALEHPIAGFRFAEDVRQKYGLGEWGPVGAFSWHHMQLTDDACGYVMATYVPVLKTGDYDPLALMGWTCGEPWPEKTIAATYATPDPDDVLVTTNTWLRVLWTFIEQKVLTSRSEMPSRAARRRAAREGRADPSIRVVHLRRLENAEHPSGGLHESGRAWQHSWLVSGHWRRQWYASRRHHAPIWIAPYAKGPADKPLKAPRPTVFAVVR